MSKIIILSGAAKNVGDFLITDKIHEHIKKFVNHDEIKILYNWESNSNNLEEINEFDKIIIAGGPGYNKNFIPKIYPLFNDHLKIKPLIIPFGLGWSGKPLYKNNLFKFSNLSKNLIREIHKKIEISSVRDEYSVKILNKINIFNTVNTGCPTLQNYDYDYNDFPDYIESDVITVSIAQSHFLFEQNLNLIDNLIKKFPNMKIKAMFHRGLGEDQFTTEIEAMYLRELIDELILRNIEIVDMAYNLETYKNYDNIGFHVGYRVHAHAYCISKKIPSYLIWEDGRGLGMSENLSLKGYQGFNLYWYKKFTKENFLRRVFRQYNLKFKKLPQYKYDENIVNSIIVDIENDIQNKFDNFRIVEERLKQLRFKLNYFLDTLN